MKEKLGIIGGAMFDAALDHLVWGVILAIIAGITFSIFKIIFIYLNDVWYSGVATALVMLLIWSFIHSTLKYTRYPYR